MYAYRRGRTWSYEFQFDRRPYRRGGFVTKRLAELAGDAHRRQLREQRVQHVYGVRDPVAAALQTPTLAVYVRDEYLPHHVGRLAPATQKTARHQVALLTTHLGHRRLYELDGRVLDRYATIRLQTVSPSTVREEIERLSRIVNHARARGVLLAHPFRGWRRPRIDRRDYRVVTPDEEARLLAAARADFRDWIVLALDTGLRKGELRVLEVRAVGAGELRLTQGKTKKVKRIPLTPRAAAIVKRRSTESRERSYIFASAAGRPWSLPWIDHRWAETLRGAGLKGIRFHDLRHTFASRLADAGESVAVVGELLGHKPPYTTTLRYFHPLPDAKRAAIARLGARQACPDGDSRKSPHNGQPARSSSGNGSPRSSSTDA